MLHVGRFDFCSQCEAFKDTMSVLIGFFLLRFGAFLLSTLSPPPLPSCPYMDLCGIFPILVWLKESKRCCILLRLKGMYVGKVGAIQIGYH